MDRQQRVDKIEEYGRGFSVLEAAVNGVPRPSWQARPAPGEWSVGEILIHMADSECLGMMRLHKLIAEPGTVLMTYDSAKWGAALGYHEQNPDEALQLFQLLRRKTHRLLRSLPDDVFGHSGQHPEYAGPYTIDRWLDVYTGHVPEHVLQIQQTAKAIQAAGR